MKYRELIQFDPIDEIIKFSQLKSTDYKEKLVRNFVCSEAYEKVILPQITRQLDYNNNLETKGIQIVGNYGTGKSHLMSLFSIIAEDSQYLDLLQNENARTTLKPIAGLYKVHRFEINNKEDLWTVVTYQLDKALRAWGMDYSIYEDHTPDSYEVKLDKMMGAFEEKYPDKGFMLVVDEMLDYLRSHSTPDKLGSDLQVLRALGHKSDRSKFRMIFGVQELIYQATEFQFAADMLTHVNERFVDLKIEKEDVQFIVQQRLLLKNEHQKQKIHQHIQKFIHLFPNMNNNPDTYVNLYPVHPSYFENFSQIRIGKSQREILKTLSHKFESILDEDVPESNPGLICYDSYWQDMQHSTDLMAIADVRRVCEITNIIQQKIENNFTGGRAPKKQLANRIVSAIAIKALQADLNKLNGAKAEVLTDDLCYVDPMADDYDMLKVIVDSTASNIIKATIGQYFEKNIENEEFHLRIEGGVNYEQKVIDYASQMNESQKDEYFYEFLAEVLPVEGDTYRNNFRIWAHSVEWISHKCNRDGYIFMGNPAARSTTQPRQHFYIYFMPIFDTTSIAHTIEKDGIFFLMNGLSDDFKQKVALYGSALAQENSADTAQKPNYQTLRKKYFNESKKLFNQEFFTNTVVEYNGESQLISTLNIMNPASKIDAVNAITSSLMENQFTTENPDYPKFTMLPQPLAAGNRENMLKAARSLIANPNGINRNGEAILIGLGLWKNGTLSTEDSPYARSLKQMLADKNEHVVNRNEILELFWEADNLFFSKDFHIEADLEMLVMATMAALGEIEVVFNGGTRINASTINTITSINPQDNNNFTHICLPKGINRAVVREIFLTLLGHDRSNHLNDPAVYADMLSAAKDVAQRAISMQNKIERGYMLNGREIISQEEGTKIGNRMLILGRLCDKLQQYNSEAKMRNIPWTTEVIKEKLTDAILELKQSENKLRELKQFEDLISYLHRALQYVTDIELQTKIGITINKIGEIINGTETGKATYMAELKTIQNEYADWYMNKYLNAHISEMDERDKQQLLNADKKRVCDDFRNSDFAAITLYNIWLQNINQLQLADFRVTKDAIMQNPYQGFDPNGQKTTVTSIVQYKEQLNNIYTELQKQIQNMLKDPSVQENLNMLTASEKEIFSQYNAGIFMLNHSYAPQIALIIQKLNHNFVKIEVSRDDLLRVFNRPMTKEQALDALSSYIEEQSRGKRPEDVRIIVK